MASASPNFHIIMAARSLVKAEQAKAEILATGTIKGSLSTVQLDVTDEASIAAAAQLVADQHGYLSVLINNAAVGLVDLDFAAKLRLHMATNAIGPALVAAAFRPLLLKTPTKDPYSIYVSSGGGSLTRIVETGPAGRHYPQEEAYRASKAAMNMIALIEARDYGEQGLKVFIMSPGFVVSNLRGTSEEARSGGGGAGDPMVSGETLLSIVQGERDADVGKFVHKDGVYPW